MSATSTTKTSACAECEDEDVVECASVTVSESSELTTESVTDTDTATINTSLGESLKQALSQLQVSCLKISNATFFFSS